MVPLDNRAMGYRSAVYNIDTDQQRMVVPFTIEAAVFSYAYDAGAQQRPRPPSFYDVHHPCRLSLLIFCPECKIIGQLGPRIK